jgi:hypothetical protein
MARTPWLLCAFAAVCLLTRSAQAEPPFPARTGSVVRDGSSISAGSAAATLQVHDGVTLTLAPGTRVEVVSGRSALRLGGSGATPTAVFELVTGTVDIQAGTATTAPGGAVLVRAPLEVSGLAASGRLRISTAPGWTAVAGVPGDVRMAVRERWKLLKPGSA